MRIAETSKIHPTHQLINMQRWFFSPGIQLGLAHKLVSDWEHKALITGQSKDYKLRNSIKIKIVSVHDKSQNVSVPSCMKSHSNRKEFFLIHNRFPPASLWYKIMLLQILVVLFAHMHQSLPIASSSSTSTPTPAPAPCATPPSMRYTFQCPVD